MSVKQVRECDECGKDITGLPRFELVVVTQAQVPPLPAYPPKEPAQFDLCSPSCLIAWAQNYGYE